jgi:predicted glycosyltransferase
MPEYTWHIIGNYDSKESWNIPSNLVAHRFVEDPFELLCMADYVIGSGGNNSIMEAASLQKKYACLPEERPFQEQTVAAAMLSKLHMAVVLDKWPLGRQQWQGVLSAMDDLDVAAFAKLVNPHAARLAASRIMETAN